MSARKSAFSLLSKDREDASEQIELLRGDAVVSSLASAFRRGLLE